MHFWAISVLMMAIAKRFLVRSALEVAVSVDPDSLPQCIEKLVLVSNFGFIASTHVMAKKKSQKNRDKRVFVLYLFGMK